MRRIIAGLAVLATLTTVTACSGPRGPQGPPGKVVTVTASPSAGTIKRPISPPSHVVSHVVSHKNVKAVPINYGLITPQFVTVRSTHGYKIDLPVDPSMREVSYVDVSSVDRADDGYLVSPISWESATASQVAQLPNGSYCGSYTSITCVKAPGRKPCTSFVTAYKFKGDPHRLISDAIKLSSLQWVDDALNGYPAVGTTFTPDHTREFYLIHGKYIYEIYADCTGLNARILASFQLTS